MHSADSAAFLAWKLGAAVRQVHPAGAHANGQLFRGGLHILEFVLEFD